MSNEAARDWVDFPARTVRETFPFSIDRIYLYTYIPIYIYIYLYTKARGSSSLPRGRLAAAISALHNYLFAVVFIEYYAAQVGNLVRARLCN